MELENNLKGLPNIGNNIPVQGNAYNSTVGSSTTGFFDLYYPKSLVNVIVDAETITLFYVQRAKYSYTTYNNGIYNAGQIPSADIAIKEVYGCVDGKLTLVKTINGRVIPPYDVAETYQFDDE